MSNKKNKSNYSESESEDDHDITSEYSNNDSDLDSDGNLVGDKEVQVDFEGRNPEDCDYNGIKQLLRQLFLKSNVDIGALTEIIISQNYIGSVVKQCLDDDQYEDDDEDDGSDGVFAITTIINITKRKEEPCIKQLRSLLTVLAEENADDKTKALISKILSDDSKHIGFVINERIVNIPATISANLFSSLASEILKAVRKGMPYSFQYLVWICKTYLDDETSELLYTNQEEAALAEKALASFTVDVSSMGEDVENYESGSMSAVRKILILDGTRFDSIVQLIAQEVGA